MRTTQLFFLSLLILSCTSTKKLEKSKGISTNSLVYVLPIEVERKINSYLQAQIENSIFYFEIRQDKNIFSLSCIPLLKNNPQVFGFLNLYNSNRVILIDTKTYPLVFESDLIFGTLVDSLKPLSLSDRIKIYNVKEYSILRAKNSIVENTFNIRFHKSGLIEN